MIDEYVVGDPNPQRWVQKGLSAYMKLDGSVGYEFSDGRIFIRLNIGDVLVNNNGKVRRREGADDEKNESIFKPGQED